MPNQTFSEGETLENMTGAEAEEQNLTVCQKPPFGGRTRSQRGAALPVRPGCVRLALGCAVRDPKIARKAFDDSGPAARASQAPRTEILGSAQAQINIPSHQF